MAAYAQAVNSTGEKWTIVAPRRGKHKRKNCRPKAGNSDDNNPSRLNTDEAWSLTDLEIDVDRELKLMQKMEICLKKLETSQFYKVFLDLLCHNSSSESDPQVFSHFSRVRDLGSSTTMKMVIYGIGSIESFEPPRLQLSLAVLLKRKFDWIGEVEVFDPVLSVTESRVIKSLGCRVLSLNEQGRREASEPILFFMPHCEAVLYNNLLETNWDVCRLRNMVLFGNSFGAYEEHVSLVKDDKVADSRKYILAARRFTDEFEISIVSDDYFRAFNESSWHFFNPDGDQGLPVL